MQFIISQYDNTDILSFSPKMILKAYNKMGGNTTDKILLI